jgi:hypothetical protein
MVYYGILGLMLAVLLWKQRFLPSAVLIQTFTLGGFFGGIRGGGVIKPYSEQTPVPGQSGVQQLNLSGISHFDMPQMLDERERHERDHAHYTAYRILRWSICGLALACFGGIALAPEFFANNAPNLLWGLCVYVLSLPQAVILWTEPAALRDQPMLVAGPVAR